MFLAFPKRKLENRTERLIEHVFESDWFKCVGEPIDDARVVPVLTWHEAIALASDPDQRLLDLSGEYTVELNRLAPKRYRQWNDIVELVKSRIVPTIDARVNELASIGSHDRTQVRDNVRWVVLHACVEVEYEDLGIRGFFLPAIEWYRSGHFPCGWHEARSVGTWAVF